MCIGSQHLLVPDSILPSGMQSFWLEKLPKVCGGLTEVVACHTRQSQLQVLAIKMIEGSRGEILIAPSYRSRNLAAPSTLGQLSSSPLSRICRSLFFSLLLRSTCWHNGSVRWSWYLPRYHRLTGRGPAEFELSGVAWGSQFGKSKPMSKFCRPINCSRRSTSAFNSSIPRPPSEPSSYSPSFQG